MGSETFEQVLRASKTAGTFTPAWKKFLKTKFFVPIVRSADNDPRNFTLHMVPNTRGGGFAVVIAEEREHLEQRGNGLVALTGAEVVRKLHVDDAVLVKLMGERGFRIAKERVAWLRKGLASSQARGLAKADPMPGADDTDADLETAPDAVAVPVAARGRLKKRVLRPAQRKRRAFDINALHPRSVAIAAIGFEFQIPGDWVETHGPTGLLITDPASGTSVEASGFHRPNVSLAQWLGMRRSLVEQEMRFLKQDGGSVAIDGEGWGQRVQGRAIEFTGPFPGDEAASQYLLACIAIDGTLVAITIKAPARVFEENRALYRWLLTHVTLVDTADTPERPPPLSSARVQDDVAAPGLVERVRALHPAAYSLPLTAVAFVLLAAMFWPADQATVSAAPASASAPAGMAPPVAAIEPAAIEPPKSVTVIGGGIAFSPPDKSFSVAMPGQPEELPMEPDARSQLGEISMHNYSLVVDERVYLVQAIDYRERAPEDHFGAMDSMQAAVIGKDGVLIKAMAVQMGNLTGREVWAQLPNGMVRAARFAFVDAKFCMVTIVAKRGEESAPYIDVFLNSFAVAQMDGSG